MNAGNEGSVFITHTCFLQGKKQSDEEWKTIDELSNNKKNTVVRQFKPTSVRYVRLLVTQSTQNNSLKAARIYELEVYLIPPYSNSKRGGCVKTLAQLFHVLQSCYIFFAYDAFFLIHLVRRCYLPLVAVYK